MTRAAMLEVAQMDFIKTARAKGVRPGRILREVKVPFARPRDPSVMRSEAFHRLVDDLTEALEA